VEIKRGLLIYVVQERSSIVDHLGKDLVRRTDLARLLQPWHQIEKSPMPEAGELVFVTECVGHNVASWPTEW